MAVGSSGVFESALLDTVGDKGFLGDVVRGQKLDEDRLIAAGAPGFVVSAYLADRGQIPPSALRWYHSDIPTERLAEERRLALEESLERGRARERRGKGRGKSGRSKSDEAMASDSVATGEDGEVAAPPRQPPSRAVPQRKAPSRSKATSPVKPKPNPRSKPRQVAPVSRKVASLASEIAQRLALLETLLEMGAITKAERNRLRREILAEV